MTVFVLSMYHPVLILTEVVWGACCYGYLLRPEQSKSWESWLNYQQFIMRSISKS